LLCRPTFAAPNPEREAYYGETHVHTSWSFDAFILGNHLAGPADAYKYAMGEVIKHPLGYDIKITRSLDWMGVTDHSEYVGTVRLANEPGSFLSKLPIAQKLIVHDAADIQRIYLWLGTAMIEGKPVKELVVPEIAETVWKENVQIADNHLRGGMLFRLSANILRKDSFDLGLILVKRLVSYLCFKSGLTSAMSACVGCSGRSISHARWTPFAQSRVSSDTMLRPSFIRFPNR
jgi:hypothetical protein